jgi:hypothetical protein
MAEERVRPGLTVELVGSPDEVWQDCKRQLKSIDPKMLKATCQLQRRWSGLTPEQRRRFGPLNMRHAPRVLRLLDQPRRDPIVFARPRERRVRRSRSTASRGDPDPEPEPPLRVIPLAAFRRELRHARGDALQRRAVSDDFFTMIPRRFTDAHIADELDAQHVLVGLHVAARCEQDRNTAGGVAAIRLAWLAELCEVSVETVRRKLHELRERGWIDFDAPDPGQRAAWKIWLTGLARGDQSDPNSTRAPHELHTDPPSVWSSSSKDLPAEDGAIPHDDRDRTSTRAPHEESAIPTDETRRDETRRNESKPTISVRRATTRM